MQTGVRNKHTIALLNSSTKAGNLLRGCISLVQSAKTLPRNLVNPSLENRVDPKHARGSIRHTVVKFRADLTLKQLDDVRLMTPSVRSIDYQRQQLLKEI
jgi:hypothetical protein